MSMIGLTNENIDLAAARTEEFLSECGLNGKDRLRLRLTIEETLLKYQEALGPAPARELLESLGFPADVTERVCYLVGHHHSYDQVDGVDYRILLEADFLVNASHNRLSREAVARARVSFFRTETGLRFLDACLLK